MSKPFSIFLTSVHAAEAAQWIRQYSEYLRPLWTKQPYQFLIPRELDDEENALPFDPDEEDYGCFDRTLVAYSASYDINTSNIRYTVDLDVEDAPCFRLLPPASSKRYSALELIAVMRSLRYNDSFRSISFSGVSLDALRDLRDPYGPDKDAFICRTGSRVAIPGQDKLSLLSQEIRALSLKSRCLRRLDFSYCLAPPTTTDSGSDIPEAIFPIIRRETLTCVDWVVLNGIKLGEADLDYLVDAASQKGSQLRALEVGNCGLSVHDLDLLMSTMVAQESALEAIDISGLQKGRLNPDTFQQYLGYFDRLRKLDLSSTWRTSGSTPLLTFDQLVRWRLEELYLNRTPVNRETVRAIAAYLASDESADLHVLQLNQCGMTGEDAAVIMRATTIHDHRGRQLHLHINENRLDLACSCLSDAIARNQTPSRLSMKMIDFKKEEHFRELVEAVRRNKTLKFLDISKASLPYDAGPETCRSLQLMFEENDTLEELDISGESAHLDVALFGIGLNLALTGLKKNTCLRVLRIEHQRLGFQGASTLASVLEENTSLREVYCEFNEINLQSFTVLVKSLEMRNRSLLVLSCMDGDRIQALDKLRREIDPSPTTTTTATTTMRRAAQNRLTRSVSSASTATINAAMSDDNNNNNVVDVKRVMSSLSEKWDYVADCLSWYLLRNYYLALGMDEADLYMEQQQLFEGDAKDDDKNEDQQQQQQQQQQLLEGADSKDKDNEEEVGVAISTEGQESSPVVVESRMLPAIGEVEKEEKKNTTHDVDFDATTRHGNNEQEEVHDLGTQFPFGVRPRTAEWGQLVDDDDGSFAIGRGKSPTKNSTSSSSLYSRLISRGGGGGGGGGGSREKKRMMDKLRGNNIPRQQQQQQQQQGLRRRDVLVKNPPRLDWSLPKVDLGFG